MSCKNIGKMHLVIIVLIILIVSLMILHLREEKREGFTNVGVALTNYNKTLGLPMCSTLHSQSVRDLELRHTGQTGTSFGWKMFWQPLSENIAYYIVKFQYDKGCPKEPQQFQLDGGATEFELPQPMNPRFAFSLSAFTSSGTRIGSPALYKGFAPHDPNKWA